MTTCMWSWIGLERCVFLCHVKSRSLQSRLLLSSFSMYGFTLDFLRPLSRIRTPDSLESFWTKLWCMMDTKLKRSTAFHPQTNGQTEVVKRIVFHFLRGYCNKHPKLWDEQIQYVQHAYNRVVHSSTQSSPFETCFGYFPKTPLDLNYAREVGSSTSKDEDKALRFIQRVQQVHQEVQEQLEKSQAQYKARHDKHRVDHQFYVGDQVWLHIK